PERAALRGPCGFGSPRDHGNNSARPQCENHSPPPAQGGLSRRRIFRTSRRATPVSFHPQKSDIMPLFSARPEVSALKAHQEKLKELHLRELFAQDPGRGPRLALDAAGVYLDFSKNVITDETVELLLKLATARDLRAKIDAQFAGEHNN